MRKMSNEGSTMVMFASSSGTSGAYLSSSILRYCWWARNLTANSSGEATLQLPSYQLGFLLLWKNGCEVVVVKKKDWCSLDKEKVVKNVCVPLTLRDVCWCVCRAPDGCNIWGVGTGYVRRLLDCQACQDEWGICLWDAPALASALLSAALIHLHLLCTSDSGKRAVRKTGNRSW